MPVIYIDVIWFINLALDGFILLVTAFLARLPARLWRMIGASAIGASYALFLFFPVLSSFLTFFCKFLFSSLMVWVAFRPKRLLEFGKILGLFYLASFLTGGAAFAANSFFGSMTVQNGLVLVSGGTVWAEQTTLAMIVLALPIVYFLGKSAWNRLAQVRKREGNLWSVQVELSEWHIELTGLLDTGNALTDPLSRTPVMVADWELFRDCLPEALIPSFENGVDISMALGDVDMDSEWQSRFRLVPYRGVGGTMGMLLAFRPDVVRLTGQAEVHTCRRVLIGLNPRPLAADGTYRAILHPSMIEGGEEPAASPDREAS